MNKKETGLPIKVKKTDRFFAFYRNKGFYQLWLLCFILSVFILCELDVPMLLIELGGYYSFNHSFAFDFWSNNHDI